MAAERRPGLAVLLLALAAAGCASPGDTLVVVLPGTSGEVGGVVVNSGQADQQLLDAPYASAWARSGKIEVASVSPREVEQVFAEARQARPQAPISFTLYFREGSDAFAPQTLPVVDEIFAEIARRPAAEIVVIGHTDRVGYKADNDLLSRQRAQRVRQDLVRLGIAAQTIKAAGRGEREPVVQTPDEVDEPRNRRVEISVR